MNGKVSYYFAMSLDGYIARLDDRVDWLDAYFCELQTPYDFKPYMETVSAVIMGRNTFEEALKLGPLPLEGKPGYVYTSKDHYQIDVPNVKVVSKNQMEMVHQLKAEHSGRIWVLGGGQFASSLLEHHLLDEIVLTIMPVTIGEGLPWLAGLKCDHTWKLTEDYSSNGIIQLVYQTERNSI